MLSGVIALLSVLYFGYLFLERRLAAKSGVYYQSRYPRAALLLGLSGAGGCFWMYLRTQRRGIGSFTPDTDRARKYKRILH